MSAVTDEVTEAAERIAVTACWRQWRSLTNAAAAIREKPASALVDPEALLLLSLSVRHRERRLQDSLFWWASEGSTLMSVQRTRTMLEAFPSRLQPGLGWFAAVCLESGDHRWQALSRQLVQEADPVLARSRKGPDELKLLDPATLVLRLRSGFGVGVKADVLSFLLGMSMGERTAQASADAIAEAICYSSASVRRAAADMVRARFLRASNHRPMEYSVPKERWGELLELRSDRSTGEALIPPWRFWSQMFSLLTKSIEWADRNRDVPGIVQASHARDILEEYDGILHRNGIPIPDPHLYPGESYLEAFRGFMLDLGGWLDAHI